MVVPLEQLRNAGLVNLHLQASDTQCAKHDDAVTVHAVVHDVDAFDTERRHGVEVCRGHEPGTPRPGTLRHQHHAGGSAVEQQLRAFEHWAGLAAVGHHDVGNVAAEPLPDLLEHRGIHRLARCDHHVGARPGQQACGADADWTCPGGNH